MADIESGGELLRKEYRFADDYEKLIKDKDLKTSVKHAIGFFQAYITEKCLSVDFDKLETLTASELEAILCKFYTECPYNDYKNESVRRCDNPDKYHCLQNEHKQQGWLCIDPIWIEEDRCPEFNSRAKKLDSRVCKEGDCPDVIFRSNQVYKYSACQLYSYKSTQVNPDPETSTLKTDQTTIKGAPDKPLYVGIAAGVIVLLIFICFTVLLVKRRKKHQKNMEKDEEMKLLDVNTNKPKTMYDRAKQFLYKDRFVVLVGTHGSGKTFMADKLKNEWLDQYMKKDKRTTTNVVNVNNVNISEETKCTDTRDRTLFLIDDLLRDLNTEMSVDFVTEKLNSWYNMFVTSESIYFVITVTRVLWQTFEKKFKRCKFFQQNIVELGDINKDERINILDDYIRDRTQFTWNSKHEPSVSVNTDLSLQQSECSMTSQTRDIVTKEKWKYDVIGYPAIIGVLWKNTRLLTDATFVMQTPVSWIRNDLTKILNSGETNEFICFTLSYMALSNGSLNLQCLDESLVEKIKKRLNVNCINPNHLIPALNFLEKGYIRKVKEKYVFENNIVHMLVFAIIGEKWSSFVTENCSVDMLLDWTCIEEEFPSSFETDRRKLYFKQPDLSIMSYRYAAVPEEIIKFNHNLKNKKFQKMLQEERSKKTSIQEDE